MKKNKHDYFDGLIDEVAIWANGKRAYTLKMSDPTGYMMLNNEKGVITWDDMQPVPKRTWTEELKQYLEKTILGG